MPLWVEKESELGPHLSYSACKSAHGDLAVLAYLNEILIIDTGLLGGCLLTVWGMARNAMIWPEPGAETGFSASQRNQISAACFPPLCRAYK